MNRKSKKSIEPGAANSSGAKQVSLSETTTKKQPSKPIDISWMEQAQDATQEIAGLQFAHSPNEPKPESKPPMSEEARFLTDEMEQVRAGRV